MGWLDCLHLHISRERFLPCKYTRTRSRSSITIAPLKVSSETDIFTLAPLPQIRSPSRLLIFHSCRQRHADSRPLATQSPHPISLPLFLCRAIRLYVDTQPARQCDGQGGGHQGLNIITKNAILAPLDDCGNGC